MSYVGEQLFEWQSLPMTSSSAQEDFLRVSCGQSNCAFEASLDYVSSKSTRLPTKIWYIE